MLKQTQSSASVDCSLRDYGACQFIPLKTAKVSDWQALLDCLPYQPVGYHRLQCDYQHAYFSSSFPVYRQLDCLIQFNSEIVGLWPLAIYGDQYGLRISSHVNGAPGISPPLLRPELSDRQVKTINQAWLGAIAALVPSLGIKLQSSLCFVSDAPWTNVPDWANRLLLQGARLVGRYRMVANLSTNDADYHRQLRKSYKSLIHKAEKTWQVTLDTIGDACTFAQFQSLHEQVAGRKTRSAETWRHQFEAIEAGAAFAVYLRHQDRLIGASLYNASRHAAYYAVGAYDRSLFDQPVAHLSLFNAIGHARTAGQQLFILGDRPFPGDTPPPSAKEARIAFFKEGFATALQLLPAMEIAASDLIKLNHPGST